MALSVSLAYFVASDSSFFSFLPAISWSAVPEHPLDVTSHGFKQGSTKKVIGSPKSRCVSQVAGATAR